MWAGSKYEKGKITEMEEEEEGKEGEKKKGGWWGGEGREKERRILGAFGDGSVVCKTYRSKRWREGEKGRGDVLEIALRVFP